jgi:hypothetical protein
MTDGPPDYPVLGFRIEQGYDLGLEGLLLGAFSPCGPLGGWAR